MNPLLVRLWRELRTPVLAQLADLVDTGRHVQELNRLEAEGRHRAVCWLCGLGVALYETRDLHLVHAYLMFNWFDSMDLCHLRVEADYLI